MRMRKQRVATTNDGRVDLMDGILETAEMILRANPKARRKNSPQLFRFLLRTGPEDTLFRSNFSVEG